MYRPWPRIKRGSSLRFIEWPMPQILASVLGSLISVSSRTCEYVVRGSEGDVTPSPNLLAHLLGRVLHGLDDIHVARAAAQVPADGLADLLLARIPVAYEERARGHQHARRAEAALQTVLLGEALLHRMELAALLQALDRGDLRAVGLHREHGAGFDWLAVEVHRAGAAVARIAAGMRARHPEHFADQVHAQKARLDFRLAHRAVDGYADLVHRHGQFPPARCTALRSARVVRTRAISFLYSTVPRRSPLGELFTAASRAASAMVFSSGIFPTRYFAASTASMGVSPAFVRPMPARSTAPFFPRVSCTAAAATAKSPVLRLSLAEAPPLRGGGSGMRISVRISFSAR